jgi:hypothetical protein
MSNELATFDGRPTETTPAATAMEIATTRSAQEVQAAMVIAKRFPRDVNVSHQRIMQACERRSFAEVSQYVYPRGGSTVSGPSIRMAEMLAQCWGNIDFGIVELEQKRDESVMMAYAWDLETNSRQTKVFTVPHVRDTKQGRVPLRDARDVYEMTANQGARRLRSCILGVIPGDIVEAAIDKCDKAMSSGNAEPLIDRVRKMAAAFAEIGVTIEMIEKRLGHKLDTVIESELVTLRKVFQSIRDNFAPRENFFDIASASPSDEGKPKAQALADKLKGQRNPEPTKPAKQEPAEPIIPNEPESGSQAAEVPPSEPAAPPQAPAVIPIALSLVGSLEHGDSFATSATVDSVKVVTYSAKKLPAVEVSLSDGPNVCVARCAGERPEWLHTGIRVVIERGKVHLVKGEANLTIEAWRPE